MEYQGNLHCSTLLMHSKQQMQKAYKLCCCCCFFFSTKKLLRIKQLCAANSRESICSFLSTYRLERKEEYWSLNKIWILEAIDCINMKKHIDLTPLKDPLSYKFSEIIYNSSSDLLNYLPKPSNSMLLCKIKSVQINLVEAGICPYYTERSVDCLTNLWNALSRQLSAELSMTLLVNSILQDQPLLQSQVRNLHKILGPGPSISSSQATMWHCNWSKLLATYNTKQHSHFCSVPSPWVQI